MKERYEKPEAEIVEFEEKDMAMCAGSSTTGGAGSYDPGDWAGCV